MPPIIQDPPGSDAGLTPLPVISSDMHPAHTFGRGARNMGVRRIPSVRINNFGREKDDWRSGRVGRQRRRKVREWWQRGRIRQLYWVGCIGSGPTIGKRIHKQRVSQCNWASYEFYTNASQFSLFCLRINCKNVPGSTGMAPSAL